MTTTNELKEKLGEKTEQLEKKAQEYWTKYKPHFTQAQQKYTKLEPWKRGAFLIALALCLLLFIYWLTKPDKNLQAKREAQAEERLLRQMAFFKKLQN